MTLLAFSEDMSFFMKSSIDFAGGFCAALDSSFGASLGASTLGSVLGSSLGASLDSSFGASLGTASFFSDFFAFLVAFLFLAWGLSPLCVWRSSLTSLVLIDDSTLTNPKTYADRASQTPKTMSAIAWYVTWVDPTKYMMPMAISTAARTAATYIAP